MAARAPVLPVETTEGILTASDGKELYTKTWQPPSGAAEATLVWLHGFGDHCNNFGDLFEVLAGRGIAVHALDQRGWGRSVACPADRGLTGPTATVLSDIGDLVAALPSAPAPLFLGGHSMGGAEALMWAARGPVKARLGVRGYVVAAPFLRIHASLAPPRAVVWLAGLLAPWFPTMALHNKPRLESCCRDPEVRKALADDALHHDTGRLASVVDMLRRGDELAAGLHPLDEGAAGLWIGHGGDDGIVCGDAVREYFARSPVRDKQLRIYRGCYHNLHQEPGQDKVDFANDVVAWIRERSL